MTPLNHHETPPGPPHEPFASHSAQAVDLQAPAETLQTPEVAPTPEAPPRKVHDYLITIGPDEETSDLIAYFREVELPPNLLFIKASPIPRKAAYAIKEGEQLHELVKALVGNAKIASGVITLMDLRDFSDEVDQLQIAHLKQIDGFTFKVFNTKHETPKPIPGLDFC